MLEPLYWIIRRDLTIAMRRRSDVFTTLIFFVIVVSLFPLGIGPEPGTLRLIAPGIVWVGALLASMLALEQIFSADHRDGTLEQMLLTPQPVHWAMIAATVALIGIAYLAIVTAMRIGEVSFVTPFRYTRIVFSLTLGVLVFGDRLDAAMLAGCTVIVGSGLYTVWRERRFRAAA